MGQRDIHGRVNTFMKLEHNVSNETIIKELMAEPVELFAFMKSLANAIQLSNLPTAYDTSYELQKLTHTLKNAVEHYRLEQYKASLAALFDDTKQDVKVLAAAMSAAPQTDTFDALLPPAKTEDLNGGWENVQKTIQEKRVLL